MVCCICCVHVCQQGLTDYIPRWVGYLGTGVFEYFADVRAR